MTHLKKLLVALTPMGAAAYVAGGGTFGSLRELTRWARSPSFPARGAAPASGDSLWRTKKALLLMMAIGAAAYFGFGGTFANFSAETANNNSSIASGTLTMSNTLNTNTACVSGSSLSQDNVNAGCDAAFALANIAPGNFTSSQVAKIAIQNTGSIDASKLYLYASYVNAKLTAGLTSGVNVTSLTVSPIEGSIASGDAITVSDQGHSQNFVTSAPAVGGATTISIVTGTNANFSYPANTNVTDTSGNTTVNNTDCYDVKTTTPGTPGATTGSVLNFNPIAGNPFCNTVLMYVQERTGTFNYCWSGKGSSPEAANGLCTTPVSVALTTGLTSGVAPSTLSVAALNGNITSGNTVTVTSGANTQTFTTTADAHFGDTSIAIAGAPAANFSYPIGSTVVNSSALTALNNDTTDTVGAFDTAKPFSGKLNLAPLTADHVVDPAQTVWLAHAGTRTFYVGLYLPIPSGSNQNQIQGLSSTFGLTWHMEQ